VHLMRLARTIYFMGPTKSVAIGEVTVDDMTVMTDVVIAELDARKRLKFSRDRQKASL